MSFFVTVGMPPSGSFEAPGVVETTCQRMGGALGDAPVDLAIEELDDLRAALGPPHFCGFDGLAVIEKKRIGQGRDGRLRFVVVGGLGADAGTSGRDVQEIEQALMILRRGKSAGLSGSGLGRGL